MVYRLEKFGKEDNDYFNKRKDSFEKVFVPVHKLTSSNCIDSLVEKSSKNLSLAKGCAFFSLSSILTLAGTIYFFKDDPHFPNYPSTIITAISVATMYGFGHLSVKNFFQYKTCQKLLNYKNAQLNKKVNLFSEN